MYRFWETIIKPVIKMVDAKTIVEIGAQNGYTTKKIIDYACAVSGEAHSIDPFPNFDYKTWENDSNSRFKMHLGLSLDVLPHLPAFDVYLIDGDHNWYTVYHELNAIKAACQNQKVLIILHDIGWPYARRDLYYNPDNIPSEYRNDYKKQGIKYGCPELQEGGINSELYNATAYATPRNGVLTAIEDFLKENSEFEFMNIDCCNGLGIIKKKGTYDNIFNYANNSSTLKLLLKQTEENRLDFFQSRYTYKQKYKEAMNAYNKQKKGLEHMQEENIVLSKQADNLKLIIQELEDLKILVKLCEQLKKDNELLQEKSKENEQAYINEIEKLKIELCEKENMYSSSIEKNTQLLTEVREQAKSTKLLSDSLKRDNELLRKEGKKIRKQCRELQKELQQIYESKTFKLARIISRVYHSPKQLFLIPIKLVKRCAQKFIKKAQPKDNNLKNTVLAEKSNITEMIYAEEEKNIVTSIYPFISEYANYNIYGDNVKLNSVSVVICIHNALNDVIECLNSVWNKRSFPYEIILIDDGSDKETQQYVENFAKLTNCKLHRNEEAQGYTKSANIGLKMAKSDYVILLNSDTIVTDSWVEKMFKCFVKHEDTGIVSPLSNAASYQSVPETKDIETGDWKINTLCEDMTVDMMGLIVEKTSKMRYPSVAALNGFCFMISRRVIETIGYLDEENFPKGYGEEVDYCIRATKAGFTLRVVDDTYIFHEKSKSFTHKTRKELGASSKPVLKQKHGEAYANVGKNMESCAELQTIREEVKEAVNVYYGKYKNLIGKKIAFVLTAKGGSGGANSVCQEVAGMRNLGIDVHVINSYNYKTVFDKNYPEIAQYVEYFDKKSLDSFMEVACKYDLLIATIFTTVNLIQEIKEKYPQIKVGYYVQDYEPYFFDTTEDYFLEAKQSYTKINGSCLFAKTKWIAETVQKYHSTKVNLVEPSIDTRLYNPFVINEKNYTGTITICGMIRPKTVRRNPVGTMEVLAQLKRHYGSSVNIIVFGCDDEEIKSLGSYDFEYKNLGILKRWEVAKLLASANIFLDMSTYQAFGRTGLESMCLGCIPVLPKKGGADKFAIDESNSLVVDTSNCNEVVQKICKLIDSPNKIQELQAKGLETAMSYNVMNAAWSEITLLNTLFE